MTRNNASLWLEKFIEQLDSIPESDLQSALRLLSDTAETISNDIVLGVWSKFLRGESHRIARGRSTALIQIAFSLGDRSTISRTVETWVQESAWNKPWLRRFGRPREPLPITCLRVLEGHRAEIFDLVHLPDTPFVLSTSADQTLRLWNVDSGFCLYSIQIKDAALATIMPRSVGNRLVSGGRDDDFLLKIRDPQTGEIIQTHAGHTGAVERIVCHTDGRHILSASQDHTLRLWNLENSTFSLVMEEHSQAVLDVAFYPDGRRAASASADGTIKLWNLQSGKRLKTLKGHNSPVRTVSLSLDGTKIISGGDDSSLKVWDAESGKLLLTLQGHKGPVTIVKAIPKQQAILSGSEDKTLKLWDLNTGQCRGTLIGHSGSISSIELLKEGRCVMSASTDGSLRFWEIETSSFSLADSVAPPISLLSFLPGGRRVFSISEDNTLKLWDAGDGACLETFQLPKPSVVCATVYGEGQGALIGSEDGTLRIWDFGLGKFIKTLKGHSASVGSILLHQDGVRVFSASHDTSIRAWNLQTGKCYQVLEGHDYPIKQLFFYPENRRLLSIDIEGTIKAWDIESGHCLGNHHLPDKNPQAFALSPEAEQLLLGTRRGLHCFDVGFGKQIRILSEEPMRHDVLDFLPDGKLLVASAGKVLTIFDTKTGVPFCRWDADSAFTASAISPNGRIILGDQLGNVLFLELVT